MSGKVRVYEVAKQLNLDPKQVVGLFQAIGVADVRNHMSSVEPEQVERIKRHLEKQRTHDVVEERVRSDGRVIKRRAIAKPGAPQGEAPPSSAAILPVSAALGPELRRRAWRPSRTDTPRRSRSSVRDRDSGRLVVPEERKSTRAVESAPCFRASGRARASCRPWSPSLLACPSLSSPSSVRPTTRWRPPRPPRYPRSRWSRRPPLSPCSRRPLRPRPRLPRSPRLRRPRRLRRPPAPARLRRPEWSTGPVAPACRCPRQSATTRSATNQPNMPRRVQYDPRAGAIGGPSGRRDVRAPGQQPGRPMMGEAPRAQGDAAWAARCSRASRRWSPRRR
jgi:translation initiation factor IF-2